VQIVPTGLSPIADADDTITFYIVRGATFGSAVSFSDRNTANSVVEVATDAVEVTGSDRIIGRVKVAGSGGGGGPPGSGGGPEALNAELKSQRIAPGESVSVYATTPGTPEFYETILRWEELF